MGINPDNLMPRLSPLAALAPMNFGEPAERQTKQQREQLKLMREQFEFNKRKHAEDQELARLEEAGRTTRSNMEAKAKADAIRAEEQRKGIAEFTKLNGEGNVEGARAMIPMLDSLGVDIELEGEVNGLPRYRIGGDPEAQARAQGAIGYPTTDSGEMQAAELPTDYAERVQAALAQRQVDPTVPMRGPDEPDYTGAVPKNVLDMSAIQGQTLARLNPALAGAVNAYPTEFQDSAQQTADAVRGMGLPLDKSIDTFTKLRSSPDSLIRSDMESQAQREAAGAKNLAGAAQEGFNYGKTIGESFQLKETMGRRGDLALIRDVLSNDNPLDDYLAGASISRLMGERGATTENDVARALGTSAMSFFERLKAGFHGQAVGGLTKDQRTSLIGVAENRMLEDVKTIHRFLDNVDSEMAQPDTESSGIGRGLRRYRDTIVPRDMRDAYERSKAGKKKSEAPATQQQELSTPIRFNMEADAAENGALPPPGAFDAELDRQAQEAELDPGAIRSVIGPESGGNANAVNPKSGATGLIQFLPSVAKLLGTSTEELSKMTAEQQIPIVIKYLKRSGLTKDSPPEDYYIAVSAPAFVGKPDETVVYKKGSKAWEDNPLWRPADGGDITVADLKRYGATGSSKTSSAPAEEAAPVKPAGDPTTDEPDELSSPFALELLKGVTR